MLKIFVLGLAAALCVQAFAIDSILPADLEERGMDSVAVIDVTWDLHLANRNMTSKCDGYSWDRVLVTLPANVPFEYSFHTLEWVDYGDRVFMEPGDLIAGVQVWKQDEINGLNRLLFKGLSRIFVIFRTKTNPYKEFRLGIAGPC